MVEIFENIRKIYDFRTPCAELSNHVEFFSESSAEATKINIGSDEFSVKMFPSWTPTLYFNFGTAYELTVGQRRYFIKPYQDILLLRDGLVERHNSASDHIFTIKLLPGTLDQLFNMSPHLLIDKIMDLRNIIPETFLQKIKQAESFEERVWIAEQFLLQKVGISDHRFRLVWDAISAYKKKDMQITMHELADQICLSSKTLNRNFHRVVGTPPKLFLSCIRARTAINSYVNHAGPFSPSAFGYFDMSHFYKEAVNFTGEKLTAYKHHK